MNIRKIKLNQTETDANQVSPSSKQSITVSSGSLTSQRLLKFQGSPKNESKADVSIGFIPKAVRLVKKSPSPSQISPQRSDEGDPDRSIKVISRKAVKIIKGVGMRSNRESNYIEEENKIDLDISSASKHSGIFETGNSSSQLVKPHEPRFYGRGFKNGVPTQQNEINNTSIGSQQSQAQKGSENPFQNTQDKHEVTFSFGFDDISLIQDTRDSDRSNHQQNSSNKVSTSEQIKQNFYQNSAGPATSHFTTPQSSSNICNKIVKNSKVESKINQPTQVSGQNQLSIDEEKKASNCDYLRNLIRQSKQPNAMGTITNKRYGSPPQNSSSLIKKVDGMNGGVVVSKQQVNKKNINFVKDMKRHGIMHAINQIKKNNEFFDQSPSPPRNEDSNNNQGSTSKVNRVTDKSQNQMPSPIAQSSITKVSQVLKQQQQNLQIQINDKSLSGKDQAAPPSGEHTNNFIFPFQRRAHSLSPPKHQVISYKINENLSPKNEATNETCDKSKDHQASPTSGDGDKVQKPVVANFLIGGGSLSTINMAISGIFPQEVVSSPRFQKLAQSLSTYMKEIKSDEGKSNPAENISTDLMVARALEAAQNKYGKDFLQEAQMSSSSSSDDEDEILNQQSKDDELLRGKEVEDWLMQSQGSMNSCPTTGASEQNLMQDPRKLNGLPSHEQSGVQNRLDTIKEDNEFSGVCGSVQIQKEDLPATGSDDLDDWMFQKMDKDVDIDSARGNVAINNGVMHKVTTLDPFEEADDIMGILGSRKIDDMEGFLCN